MSQPASPLVSPGLLAGAPSASSRLEGEAATLPLQGGALERLSRLVSSRRAVLLRAARAEGLSTPAGLFAVRDAFETLLSLPQAAAVAASDEWLERVLLTLVRHVGRRRAALDEVAALAGRDRALVAPPLLRFGAAAAVEDDRRRSADALVEAADARLRAEGGRTSRRTVERAVIALRLFDPGSAEPELARTLRSDARLPALRRAAASALLAFVRGGARA